MNVYLVTTGEYSGYGVRMVCSTRERAEAALRFFSEPNDIEEWAVDEALPPEPMWQVWLYPNGEQEDDARLVDPEDEPFGPHFVPARSDIPLPAWWTLRVMAATKEQALKIARDKVAIARAHQEGLA